MRLVRGMAELLPEHGGPEKVVVGPLNMNCEVRGRWYSATEVWRDGSERQTMTACHTATYVRRVLA
jgi:hypothetical protein